jgi:hypothetical protein
MKNIKGKNNPNYGNRWSKKQKIKQSLITKSAMKSEEIRKKLRDNHYDCNGKNNPNYIDGRNEVLYPNKFLKIRIRIRNRDEHNCQNPECNMTEKEHLKLIGRVLDIHHIDYNKENCSEDNLITLCHWCNAKANYNRDYWYAYFRYIMEKSICQKNV